MHGWQFQSGTLMQQYQQQKLAYSLLSSTTAAAPMTTNASPVTASNQSDAVPSQGQFITKPSSSSLKSLPSHPPSSPLHTTPQPPVTRLSDTQIKDSKENDGRRVSESTFAVPSSQPTNNNKHIYSGQRQNRSRHEVERRAYDQKTDRHSTSDVQERRYLSQHDKYDKSGNEKGSWHGWRYHSGHDNGYSQDDRNYGRESDRYYNRNWDEPQQYRHEYNSRRTQSYNEQRSRSYSQYDSHQKSTSSRRAPSSERAGAARKEKHKRYIQPEFYTIYPLPSEGPECYDASFQQQTSDSGKQQLRDSSGQQYYYEPTTPSPSFQSDFINPCELNDNFSVLIAAAQNIRKRQREDDEPIMAKKYKETENSYDCHPDTSSDFEFI